MIRLVSFINLSYIELYIICFIRLLGIKCQIGIAILQSYSFIILFSSLIPSLHRHRAVKCSWWSHSEALKPRSELLCLRLTVLGAAFSFYVDLSSAFSWREDFHIYISCIYGIQHTSCIQYTSLLSDFVGVFNIVWSWKLSVLGSPQLCVSPAGMTSNTLTAWLSVHWVSPVWGS